MLFGGWWKLAQDLQENIIISPDKAHRSETGFSQTTGFLLWDDLLCSFPSKSIALKLMMLIQQGVCRSLRVSESKLKLTILSRSNVLRSRLDSEKAFCMWALYFFIEKICERHQAMRTEASGYHEIIKSPASKGSPCSLPFLLTMASEMQLRWEWSYPFTIISQSPNLVP